MRMQSLSILFYWTIRKIKTNANRLENKQFSSFLKQRLHRGWNVDHLSSEI